MLSNLENISYNLILQQKTYHKLLGQFISLGETLTDANDHKGLNSDTVTRILSVKFRMQQPDLHPGWRAATNIKSRLDVNYIFKFDLLSCTLAHLAVANGSYKLLKALLGAGADVNTKDTHGNTPLHLAVVSGNVKVVSALLKAGADKSINTEDEDGKIPLHYAAANGSLKILKYLLKKGAGINTAERKNGRTAVHYAVANGSLELLQ